MKRKIKSVMVYVCLPAVTSILHYLSQCQYMKTANYYDSTILFIFATLCFHWLSLLSYNTFLVLLPPLPPTLFLYFYRNKGAGALYLSGRQVKYEKLPCAFCEFKIICGNYNLQKLFIYYCLIFINMKPFAVISHLFMYTVQ